jgi:hypothetical protein
MIVPFSASAPQHARLYGQNYCLSAPGQVCVTDCSAFCGIVMHTPADRSAQLYSSIAHRSRINLKVTSDAFAVADRL